MKTGVHEETLWRLPSRTISIIHTGEDLGRVASSLWGRKLEGPAFDRCVCFVCRESDQKVKITS